MELNQQKCKIERGVIFYSYQYEYYTGKMSLEDCFAAASKIGAKGIDINPTQMVPGYPHPTEAFINSWLHLLGKYKLESVAMNTMLDAYPYKFRRATDEESYQQFTAAIDLAGKLGFKKTRLQPPKSILEKCFRYAEEKDIAIGYEIHAPLTFRSREIQDVLDFIHKHDTKHIGFIPDLGIFSKRLPPVMINQFRRGGAQEKIISFLEETYQEKGIIENSRSPDCIYRDDLKKMGASAVDYDLLGWSGAYAYSDLADLKEMIPYTINIHGKFYEMTEDYREPSVDYEGVVSKLIELGYEGYIVSEYEGQRWVEDIMEVDSVEQVRRQHMMLMNLLGH